MATATDAYGGSDYDWRFRSISHSSMDVVSPLHPNRPIRPLPKRSLRARLTPAQADCITYPSPPAGLVDKINSPFCRPNMGQSVQKYMLYGEKDHNCSYGADQVEAEQEERQGERGRPGWSQLRPRSSGKGSLTTAAAAAAATTDGLNNGILKHFPPGPVPPVDDYDTIENTTSKKRKIPVSGTCGFHANLEAEMASMDISTHAGDDAHDGDGRAGEQHHRNTTSVPTLPGSGPGFSGAGRGRYGRSAARSCKERRPLEASTFSLNISVDNSMDRTGTSKGGLSSENGFKSGIISTAIANANTNAPDIAIRYPKDGKENVSLLQQEAAKPALQKSLFTFTCGLSKRPTEPGKRDSSPAIKRPTPPIASPFPGPSSPPRTVLTTQTKKPVAGTETSPQAKIEPRPAMPSQQTPAPVSKGEQPAPPEPQKKLRRPGELYAMAARRRRRRQEYTTYHNRPSRDDMWICEFCEYETIFGEPPRALIRQYEIKDHEQRKRMAEKRRLLEKAKAKGRKGKKAAAAAAAAKTAKSAAAPPPTSQQSQEPCETRNISGQQKSPDGAVDDHYDDDVDPPPPPPPHPKLSTQSLTPQHRGHGSTAGKLSDGRRCTKASSAPGVKISV